VLLAEDDLDDREIFISAMDKMHPGIRCATVKNGLDALLFLKNNDYLPDFIFLDLNMPVMDGRKCLSRIKENTQWAGIPVFIYSTSSRPEEKIELEMLGAASFLKKSHRFKHICNEISCMISASHEGKEV